MARLGTVDGTLVGCPPNRLAARTGQGLEDYDLGWEHSISEIFAEDYVQLHMRSRYGIGWLRAPGPGIKAALRSDLRNR